MSDSKVSAVSNSRRLATNAVWSLLGFSVPSVVMLIAIPVYIGFLGLRDYGLFALANSLVGLAGVLNLGLGQATTKFVAEYSERGEGGALRPMVYATLLFYLTIGLIGWVTLWFVSEPLATRALGFEGDEARRAVRILRIVAAGFVPTVAFTVAAGVFNGLQQYRASQLLAMTRSSLSLIVGVSMLALGFGLEGLTIGIVCVLWTTCAAGFAIGLRRLPKSGKGQRLGRKLIRRVLGFSFYTSLTSVGSIIVGQVDKVLLGSLLGLEAVSVYAVGQQAALKINVFNTAVARVLMPFFSARSVDAAKTGGMVKTLVAAWRASLVIGGSIACLALAVSPFALRVWLGPDLAADALPIFALFVVTYGLNGINIVPYFYLLGRDRPDVITWPALIGGAAMIGGIALFAPRFGLVGAAASSLIYPVVVGVTCLGATRITEGYTSRSGVRPGSLGFLSILLLAAFAGFALGVGVDHLIGSAFAAFIASAIGTGAVLIGGALYGVRRNNPFYETVFTIAKRLRKRI